MNPEQFIADKKVDQAIKRLEYIRQQYSDRRVLAWVVSTAGVLQDDVNQWPKIEKHDGALQVWQAQLTQSVVTVTLGHRKNIATLLNEDWIKGLKQVKSD